MQPRKRRNPKSSCWLGSLPSAIAIAGMVATVAVVAPVRAAVLNQWNFDDTTRRLTLTLPNGITPDYFLLAEPARIVLNVPNTTLGAVSPAQQYTGAIRSIRLSEVQSGSRVVIEFAPNTILDPRHAELTSQDLGNGQTQWTLRPLLRDAPPANVAVAPSAPAQSAASTPAPRPEPAAPPPTANAPSPPSTAPPAAPSSAAEPIAAPPAAPPEAAPSPALPEEDSQPAPASEGAIETTAPDDPPAEPIAVIPAPATLETAETTADLPSLPDIANTVTTGAAQALPSQSPLPSGVRTDAAALAGVGEANDLDTPLDQIPIDPFASSSQAAVSVPSLEEADSTPAPQVSVPEIAEVPDAPAAPPSASAASEPSGASNQVRPPGTEPAEPPSSPRPPYVPVAEAPAAAPPPAAVATEPTVSPDQVRPPTAEAIAPTPPASPAPAAAQPPAPPAPSQAVAANSIEIPAIPLPPDHWRDRADADLAPSQVRPPTAEAIAQVPPDVTGEAVAQPQPPAPSAAGQAPSAVTPPTRRENTIPPPPNPEANANNAAAGDRNTLPPPFLEGTGTSPTVEPTTIPPPPSRPAENGTVPFGTPLPQTKALSNEPLPNRRAAMSGIPVGTRMALQYSGAEPLVLAEEAPVYEVLTVAGDVYDPDTGALLLPSGTQVLGRFEGFDSSGRRFVTQVVIANGDRRPLLAESDWIIGAPQPGSANVAIGSGIGAAAVTVLSGLSGVGLVGGAAVGAAASVLESPRLVVIEPGQIIEAEVVSDILPFNDAPDITRQYR